MPTLMVQGTTSDAGKSVLVAGLCRLFARRGAKVVPFKSQNMALNSAVTVDGGEIGRSQAVQAQACFLEPHTDMNPVLLKPSSDTNAQVILQGKAITQMEAAAFHDYKTVAMNMVLDSYQRLTQQYQVILVEGAGSPAEINLRKGDIANMGFAERVDCPVIIVADIDRGGVFAHLVGTLDLLSSSEQARVQGFVINRFRGDIALLQDGLDWLEQRTGKPVLGVVPYLPNFYLDSEDAIATGQFQERQHGLTVVVPVFPRISNHTDFDALRLAPNINVKMVSIDAPMPECDLLILPGSKNVRADLRALKNSGWVAQIQKHLRYGGKVIGLCGGYQMLGEVIDDPDGIEDRPGSEKGLGLLPMRTTLHQQKQLTQACYVFDSAFENTWADTLDSEERIRAKGYEIHCGQSVFTESVSALFVPNRTEKHDLGAINADNNVLGTYLHGVFDTPKAASLLLNWAGLESPQVGVSLNEVRETQLERMADALEACLDAEFLTNLYHR